MSEPRTQAQLVVEVIPGVYRWWVEDDRIGGEESDSHAVVRNGRVVLIDPLPVLGSELDRLGDLEAIVLTASCHQRSAWRLRRQYGVRVYAPEGAVGLEEEPDARYSAGEALPGGLVAFHAPGPVESMYVLWLDKPRPTVFLADILTHDGGGVPGFIEGQWQDEPRRTRTTVQRIVDQLPVEVLCFNHGPPILSHGAAALRRALAEDHEFESAGV